jgi:molybdopterin-guanine dinucleotide biosynthesis protein
LASSRATPKSAPCRLIVVGGHTRSIGKTQLVCDLIAALPQAQWLAGKITQYGHGVCAQNGQDCDCAPTDHVVALDWEAAGNTLTHPGSDSARFLQAGAERAFWLRTKQGYLAEGMPLLREALASAATTASSSHARESPNVIIESNSLLQFVKPSLYVTVFDASREDFKDSARQVLDRADVFVFRRGLDDNEVNRPRWLQLPTQLLREKPSLLQREGEPLPETLFQQVKRILEATPTVAI